MLYAKKSFEIIIYEWPLINEKATIAYENSYFVIFPDILQFILLT